MNSSDDDDVTKFPSFYIARRSLRRNSLRSVLAVVSIVIGVMAIATMGIFGTALQQGATATFSNIGDEVIVTPAYQEGVTELTDRDVSKIRRAAQNAEVVPVKSTYRVVRSSNEEARTQIYGMKSPGTIYNASRGSVPPELRSGVVVGRSVAERFDLQPGSTLPVGDDQYRVRAVLKEVGGFSPVSPNNAVIVPESEFGTDSYGRVIVTTRTTGQSNAIASSIEDELNGRDETVSVLQLSQLSEGIDQLFGLINRFLIGIGFVSLVVAGVSILNVMLMSTIERREEIGVLRSIGVGRVDVLKIILLEAALLGVLGSAVGVLLAITAGMALNALVVNDALATFAATNLKYLAFAGVTGVAITVFSGLYPAWRAANDRPAEAIRDG